MNNLTIIGRLGAEPVVRTTKETIVARISLGVNHKKDNVEETEWLEVILWNNLTYISKIIIINTLCIKYNNLSISIINKNIHNNISK